MEQRETMQESAVEAQARRRHQISWDGVTEVVSFHVGTSTTLRDPRLWMDTRLGEGWEKEETPAGSIVSADSVTMVSSLTVTLEHLCPAL